MSDLMPDDVTLLFHLTECEFKRADAAVVACGASPLTSNPEELYAVLLEEVDKVIPNAKLAERSKSEKIGLAIVRPGASLPDNRFQRLQATEAPPTPPNAQGAPARGRPVGIMAAALAPTSAIQAKVNAAAMIKMPTEQVQALKGFAEQASSEMPWPTHEGKISIDGKVEIKVYQLSNGQRVIDVQDLQRFFDSFGGM